MYQFDDVNKITVNEDCMLHDGLEVLDREGLQIILIVDDKNKLIGTITDGDVRRHILRGHELDVPVSEIMNRNFTSLAEERFDEAISILKSAEFNHIPIIDNHGSVTKVITNQEKNITVSDKKNVPVVIMAGGKGTRLSPLTKIIPKPLIPVGDVTMLEKIMSNFYDQGFGKFYIIVNYKKELIKSYIAELDHPYEIIFIEESEYYGTAGGLRALNNIINGAFILTNCDILTEVNYQSFINWHCEHNASLTVLGVRKQIDIPYGVISVDKDSLITSIKEKPSFHHVIVSGVYILNSKELANIPAGKRYDMDKMINDLLTRNENITCFPIEKGWFDMGQFKEYRTLLKHFGLFE